MNKSVWAKISNAAGQVLGNFVTGTKQGDKYLLDVAVKELVGSLTGSFTPSGLQNEGKHQLVTITSSGWTQIPTTALTNRNQINIQNNTGYDVKINHGTVSSPPVVGYQGMTIVSGGERFYQITDGIVLFARLEASAPDSDLDIEELS